MNIIHTLYYNYDNLNFFANERLQITCFVVEFYIRVYFSVESILTHCYSVAIFGIIDCVYF